MSRMGSEETSPEDSVDSHEALRLIRQLSPNLQCTVSADAAAATVESQEMVVLSADCKEPFLDLLHGLLTRFAGNKNLKQALNRGGRTRSSKVVKFEDGSLGLAPAREANADHHPTVLWLLHLTYSFLRQNPHLVARLGRAAEQTPSIPAERSNGVKAAATPVPFAADAAPLRFPNQLMGQLAMSPTELGNVMVLGGTGVGKTTAVIANAIAAAIDYGRDEGYPASVLIVDPKSELIHVARDVARATGRQNDLMILGSDTKPLHAFYDGDGKGFLERMKVARAFGSGNAETYYTDKASSDWASKSLQFYAELVALSHAIGVSSGGPSAISLILTHLGESPAANSLWSNVESFANQMSQSFEALVESCVLLELMRSACGVKLANPLSQYTCIEESMASEQLMYIVRGGKWWVSHLAEAERTGLASFDPCPSQNAPRLDLAEVCRQGRVLVYQPDSTDAHAAIGRLLKTQFFEAVTHRRQADAYRAVFYVADEAHRFVTTDLQTGEAYFLDRCRAYRTVCVMATQSLSGLIEASSRNSVESILANCRTMIYMRNTDPITQSSLFASLPRPRIRGLPHVCEVRPLSALNIGQYYWTSNGRWGVFQYRLPQADSRTAAMAEHQ